MARLPSFTAPFWSLSLSYVATIRRPHRRGSRNPNPSLRHALPAVPMLLRAHTAPAHTNTGCAAPSGRAPSAAACRVGTPKAARGARAPAQLCLQRRGSRLHAAHLPARRAVGDAVGMAAATQDRCLLTTSITATSVPAALDELREAEQAGADIVELRLDCLDVFDATKDLPSLLAGTRLPAIATLRASWEGGKYKGTEEARVRALWHAVELGAAFVDVELKAAAPFFAAAPPGWKRDASRTRFILSSHNYAETPSLEDLRETHRAAVAAGADIVKIATTSTSITDVQRLEALLSHEKGRPTIALGMGEAGLVRHASHTKHAGAAA